MEKKLETRRFLGLSRHASPEEIETRCEELVEWLESGGIPQKMRSWASSQVAIVREIYESLPAPDGEAEGSEGATLSIEKPVVERRAGVRDKREPLLSKIGSSPM